MELVLDVLDTVAVVLPLQSAPVQRGLPVLVPINLPGEPIRSLYALVDGVHHPVAEVYINQIFLQNILIFPPYLNLRGLSTLNPQKQPNNEM